MHDYSGEGAGPQTRCWHTLYMFPLSALCVSKKSTTGDFSSSIFHLHPKLKPSCVFISGVAQFSEISQPVSFQTAKLGDAATIECYIKTSLSKAAWYKLTSGGRLQLVARMNLRFNWTTTPIEFHQHYSVRSGCHLSITATEWEDVGIYFCGVTALNNMEFGSGTFLMLKGGNSSSVVSLKMQKFLY